MRWSQMFIPTLREDPAEADSISQKLLIRAGFIRQMEGSRVLLPLGQRTMLRILQLIRNGLNGIGAQEFHFSEAPPVESRAGRALSFGAIAASEIRSYKDLPQIWYRIQEKPQDADSRRQRQSRLRPCSQVEIWSLAANPEGMEAHVHAHRDWFGRIFRSCELAVLSSAADAGTQPDAAEDFMVPASGGTEEVLTCACGYAAGAELALSRLPVIEDPPSTGAPQEVHTPGQKTIAEIADFLQVPPSHQIKSLVYVMDDRPCLLLLRGDHQLSEAKAIAAAGALRARPADQDEIRALFGAQAGSLGPVGVRDIPVYADLELRGRINLTCGANRNDYHLQSVTPGVHFQPVWKSLRKVENGEACARCGSALKLISAARVGSVRTPAPSSSQNPGWFYLAADGKQAPICLAGFSLFPEGIMNAAIEAHHDEDGILWPEAIAPFQVILTPIQYKEDLKAAADRLYENLRSAGIDVLIDDRAERPGVKFKDADLIGIPFRLVLGPEKLKQGTIELFRRATREKSLIPLDSAVAVMKEKSETGSRLPPA